MDKDAYKAKEYLTAYRKTVTKIKSLELQIMELRAGEMGAAIQYSDMPKGCNQSDLSDYAARLDELTRKLDEEMKKSYELLGNITRTINRLDNYEEQLVLTLRYIRGNKWEEMLIPLKMSWRTMHRVHSRALISIARIIDI